MSDVRTAPCRNCEDRYLGCHSSCPRYKKFREAVDRAKPKTDSYVVCEYCISERTAREKRSKKYGK